jgi:hypothetical protein
MKALRMKIKQFVTEAWSEIRYGLKCLCGQATPVRRFVAVLTVCCVLAVANIYSVISSVYGIGKRDAKKEFLRLQHIESLKLQSRDSIKN